MDPQIWGKPAWTFFYSVVLGLPNQLSSEQSEIIKDFFTNVGKILPCFGCRNNYKRHIKKHPLTSEILKTKLSLFRWLVDMENEVRLSQNRELLTYKGVLKKYHNMYKIDNNNIYHYIKMLLLLVLLFAILLMILFVIFKK